MREKLIELLLDVSAICHKEECETCREDCYIRRAADHLIANGVTFAKDTNVLTNGDRVRAMSDEELAEWNNFCPYPTDECTLKGCTNCIREWLKQPASKGENR